MKGYITSVWVPVRVPMFGQCSFELLQDTHYKDKVNTLQGLYVETIAILDCIQNRAKTTSVSM